MFLAFLLELDKFTLAMLMVDIEATMASLVTLTRWETTFSMVDLGRSGVTDVSSLAVNAYLGLAKLCSRLHDEGAGGVSVVLRGLLSGVLMGGEGVGRCPQNF